MIVLKVSNITGPSTSRGLAIPAHAVSGGCSGLSVPVSGTLQDPVQTASAARQTPERSSEGSGPREGLSRPGPPEQHGLGLPCSGQTHRTAQRPASEDLSTFIPRQLAGIFLGDATSVVFKRWKWKRKKEKLQIDIISPRSYFSTETTGEPTHHFKMLLTSALPRVWLLTCKPAVQT